MVGCRPKGDVIHYFGRMSPSIFVFAPCPFLSKWSWPNSHRPRSRLPRQLRHAKTDFPSHCPPAPRTFRPPSTGILIVWPTPWSRSALGETFMEYLFDAIRPTLVVPMASRRSSLKAAPARAGAVAGLHRPITGRNGFGTGPSRGRGPHPGLDIGRALCRTDSYAQQFSVWPSQPAIPPLRGRIRDARNWPRCTGRPGALCC